VSVDTNTKGKNLDPYQRLAVGDVEFLVPATLQRWAANLIVDAKRSLLGTRFVVEAGHAHGPT
jgi:hypothetical protein